MASGTYEEERALWFVTLTQTCNLKCIYCGSDDTFDVEDLSPHPRELTYDIERLERLRRETPPPVVCFYGGEPLIRLPLMRRAMDALRGSGVTFVLQTNGLLLHTMDDDMVTTLDAVLVSIDGDEHETDRNRGDGTYAKVIREITLLRQRGFRGDLIARMTVSDGHQIEPAVSHLLGLGLFDHVHWQLDVLWDSPMFARWEDFLGWRNTSYNPGITALAQKFREALDRGVVLGIAPFLGLLWSLLTRGRVDHIRCSAGFKAFNITTGGQVTACPIAPEFKSLAEVTPDFEPSSVHRSVSLDPKCLSCDILNMCGGRCLYANKTDWWGEEGFQEVCQTVRHIIKLMEDLLPHVQRAIASGRVTLEQFHYPRYNNSIEVIP
ncbi:radical SAM domain protein [Pelomyxa schiedti]|nr:radical SAM domain protein [Pelomyxa schiedti]